ncbi:MAG: hypothetical protein AB7U38_04775 [Hyphomicrobiales bacterium]
MKSASFFATLAIAIAVGLAAAAPSLAQDAPSKDQMLKALKKPATRSLVITDPAK